jgi:hypothetical protein
LITKWNAGRTSSYPIFSYFTGFLYNKDIFPENNAVATNPNRPVKGGGSKRETTFLDLIFWFKPALYDEKTYLYYVIQQNGCNSESNMHVMDWQRTQGAYKQIHRIAIRCKRGKAIPLQAWTGPEGSRRLRLPDKTIGT